VRFGRLAFGSIDVDGKTYDHDLVVDRGQVRQPPTGFTRAAPDPVGPKARMKGGSGANEADAGISLG
jgi:hypothetical protein